MINLRKAVQEKIDVLGVKGASKYFGVSVGTASNWISGKTDPSIEAAQLVLEERLESLPPYPEVQEELAQWNGKKVLFLLPSYKELCPENHYTLFANYAKYGPEKIGMIQEKMTQIHEARNRLVQKARLVESAEWFFFVDDDMAIPCGAAGIMNGRYGGQIPEPGASALGISWMMKHPPDKRIVGALYFGRHRFGQAQTADGFGEGCDAANDRLRSHVYTGLIPQRWVGPGFMRIHRSVFDDLDKAIAAGKFPECTPNGPTRPAGYFTPMRAGMGEDVSFGLRCTEIGITSYLDPVLECLHFGPNGWGSHNTKNKPK